jgi:hypothetical protein
MGGLFAEDLQSTGFGRIEVQAVSRVYTWAGPEYSGGVDPIRAFGNPRLPAIVMCSGPESPVVGAVHGGMGRADRARVRRANQAICDCSTLLNPASPKTRQRQNSYRHSVHLVQVCPISDATTSCARTNCGDRPCCPAPRLRDGRTQTERLSVKTETARDLRARLGPKATPL